MQHFTVYYGHGSNTVCIVANLPVYLADLPTCLYLANYRSCVVDSHACSCIESMEV